MSSTDDDPARMLAGALFDGVISPLAETRAATGRQPYFSTARDAEATTYYVEPQARTLTATDMEFPGGGSVLGLVDALAARWQAQGEPELAAMAPRLKEIAEALQNEPEVTEDGEVTVFCYTMF